MTINNIITYQDKGRVNKNEILILIGEKMDEGAYVYAVLDHAACLGKYKNRKLKIGLGIEKKIEELPFSYLQELRVFNQKKELRIIRREEKRTIAGGFEVIQRRMTKHVSAAYLMKHINYGAMQIRSILRGGVFYVQNREEQFFFQKSCNIMMK